jgi:hypothetical protein
MIKAEIFINGNLVQVKKFTDLETANEKIQGLKQAQTDFPDIAWPDFDYEIILVVPSKMNYENDIDRD